MVLSRHQLRKAFSSPPLGLSDMNVQLLLDGVGEHTSIGEMAFRLVQHGENLAHGSYLANRTLDEAENSIRVVENALNAIEHPVAAYLTKLLHSNNPAELHMGFRVREALYTVKSAIQKVRAQTKLFSGEAAEAVCRFRMLLMMLMAHQVYLKKMFAFDNFCRVKQKLSRKYFCLFCDEK